MANVSFNEVQNYAKVHNLDFKTAARKLGLSAKEAEALEKLGGDPGAPVDGFEAKTYNFKGKKCTKEKTVTLKSGRQVEVYKDVNTGKRMFQYKSADGTVLKEDYFLKKEGLTGRHFAVNSKGQLVTVKNSAGNKDKTTEEEPGFFTKAWNKIKSDVKSYGENFSNAWKNSSGVLGTAGALLGAATKTATDMVEDHAENIEKGVTALTGSETAGKIAKYASGAGLAAGVVDVVDQASDWGADKIREAAKNYSGENRALLESFADYVEDLNAADIALLFAGGAGAAGAAGKFATQLPKILNLLKLTPSLAKTTVAGAVVAGALTSCSDSTEEILPDINNSNNAVINISISDQKALIAAFKEGIDALLAKMDELGLKIDQYGDQIIKLLTDNNTYLKNISNSLTEQGYKQDEILEILTNINSTVETISSLIEATNETLVVNGQNVSAQLTAILNAIKTGQATSMDQLDKYMEELRNLLYQVITNQKDEINVNEENGMTLDKILDALRNMDGMTSDKLETMLEILQSIESIGKDISGKLDVIIGKFDDAFPDNTAIQNALDRIEQYLKENNDKTDVTNSLLTELLNKYQNGTISEDMLQKILDAISKNGDKIDATNQLLAKIQNQDEKFQENVLNAISKLSADVLGQLNNILTAINNCTGGSGAKIEALLNKILEKMDSNTGAIIDAIGNIKVTGGGVIDLSSIESMLKELISLAGKNNDILSDINAKMDVLNVTADAILGKLDDTNKDHKVIIDILNAIKNTNCKGYDDTELLKILDLLSGKLDQILAAIKDHDVKVTVDVTGKVTCDCNCGGNHEGILGDLEEVLG